MSVALTPLALAVLLLAGWAHAEPTEVERLRAENTALTARVEKLEAENAELRILAGLTSPPGAETAPTAPLTATYDEATGDTTVETVATRLTITAGSRSRHWLRAFSRHPGRNPREAVGGRLEIETAGSGGVYRNVTTLRLWVDGEPHECQIVDYRSTAVTVGGGQRLAAVNEHVTADLPAALLARIATARQVRGELGPTAFQLTPAQIVAFRALQRRLEG
jgi:hypothetical protein